MKKDFLGFIKKGAIILVSLFIFSLSIVGHALPFDIITKAGTTLPTAVNAGSTVNAYYTVTNKTTATRNNNYLKWIPLNVRQVTSGGTYGNTCGATFNLAPQGQAGDSCTLQLAISGSVSASDPDPRHHLFVCFPGGRTCAGTNNPLNVQALAGPALTSITIAPSSLAADNPNSNINVAVGYDATKQLTATGHYADNSTKDITTQVSWSSSLPSVAIVGTNGLTTANTVNGQTAITATEAGVEGSITLSVVPFAYAVDFNGGNGRTYKCAFNNSNQIDTCTQTTYSPSKPWGIGASTTSSSIYIADTGGGVTAAVYHCPLTNTGDITSCSNVGYDSSILGGQPVAYIAINPTATIAYLTNANGAGRTVGFCRINPSNGTFSGCENLCTTSSCGSTGIVVSPDNKWAYINGRVSILSVQHGAIYACPIISSGPSAGTFGSCNLIYTTPTTDPLYGLAINPEGNTLYATDGPDNASTINIYTCSIDSPGHIGSCTLTVQPLSTGSPGKTRIALNPSANYAYTVGAASGSNSFCSASVSSLGSCIAPSSPTSFNQLEGIATFE